MVPNPDFANCLETLCICVGKCAIKSQLTYGKLEHNIFAQICVIRTFKTGVLLAHTVQNDSMWLKVPLHQTVFLSRQIKELSGHKAIQVSGIILFGGIC